MRNKTKLVAFLLLCFTLLIAPVSAQEDGPTRPDRPDTDLPASLEELRLDSPITMSGVDAEALGLHVNAANEGKVIIRLSQDAVAEHRNQSVNGRKAQKNRVLAQQQEFVDRVLAIDPNAQVLGSVQIVLNAVFVEVDATKLGEIAQDPAVVRVAPVGNYELDLSETVPYIGAAAVQSSGFDGSGISVAVLDSGIDYYHAALGGSGDVADYNADDPNVIEPGTFPTAKVVGGYDFVGSQWPNAPEAPDPDPLDDGPTAGHGTHVAHIIGGVGGVAPGVDLYGVKVCSSVSSSCSGIALIQGMEFAVDPDGNGNLKDAVDIINMSLGASYGQPFDDDLSAAVDNASALGVLSVVSAGNSADKPYIVGTPSAAPTALSVAQTQVPSAALQLITVNSNNYPAVFQPWSVPLTSTVSGPVQYGNGAGGNLNGCAPFAPGSLSGLVVLVDRGACNFTLKIKNISDAGGVAGIIGLVAPGAPFSGGDGGDGPINIPGYMISQADSTAIKAQVGSTATIDPNNQLPLAGQLVGSSSRGPSQYYQQIKPEIGAPGASVSANAGTGTGEGPFGGTSGAAPMVAGSAALVLEAFGGSQGTGNGQPPGNAVGHGLSPLMVKALLMNNAETSIDTDPFTGLAPITRIGGGEVRVDQAVDAPIVAFEESSFSGGLSFGMHEVADTITLHKTVTIRNLTNQKHTYDITPTFRYGNDAASGAVSVSAPSSVTVKKGLGKETTFTVSITIDADNLPGNYMNSGSQGANPAALTLNEYDGYLVLDDGSDVLTIPWHVLPRKAAEVSPSTATFSGGGFPESIALTNNGEGTAQLDAYSLLAVSPNLPEGARGGQNPVPDTKAVGINTFTTSGCASGFIWAFAVDTWEDQSHLLPVKHFVYLDTNQDGTDDYVVFNNDFSVFSTGSFGSISDGRQVTIAFNLNTGGATVFFFAEHATNTGNTSLLVCGEQVGLSGADILSTNVDMRVETFDFYFGGSVDIVDNLTVTPLGEQYFGVTSDIPGNGSGGIDIYDFGPFPGNSPELGVMVFTNGDRGTGARGGATDATDTLYFGVDGADLSALDD